ncbi:MAG: prephenate dehydrogenase, partial [Methanobrevibacter sp.]|nr:prephenate dehydrogenase [Methanobrevibacter sp.]
KVHIGVLEELDNKTAVLKRGNKVKKLRIANIRIMLPDELHQWKVENSAKITRSISCVFSKNVNVETIQNTVMKIDNIINIKLIDAYSGPQIADDSISLTFEIIALEKDAVKNVENLFIGFGGTIR